MTIRNPIFPVIHSPLLGPLTGRGGSAFSPLDVPNLLRWWDASDADTITHVSNVVTAWADKSGNDAHLSQGTATREPTYVPANDSLTFDGSADFLENSSPCLWHAEGCSIYMVAGAPAQAGPSIFAETNTGNANPLYRVRCLDTDEVGFYMRNDSTSTLVNSVAVTTSSPLDGNKKLFVIQDQVNLLSISVDDAEAETAAYSRSGTLTLNRFQLGASALSQFCEMEVHEIIIIRGTPTTAHDSSIKAYLTEKWSGAMGAFAFNRLFISNEGQSLGVSSDRGAPITVSQDGNNFAYPRLTQDPADDAWKPAISTDGDIQGLDSHSNPVNEGPMFGMLAFLRELIETENGIVDTDHNLHFGTLNNAYGSAPVTEFSKGVLDDDSYYALWYQATTANQGYAASNGQRFWAPFTLFTQGEAEYDNENGGTLWYNTVLAIAQDKAADTAALGVGGPLGHRMLIYQTNTRPPGASDYGVARKQYELARDYPDLITFTLTNYYLDFTPDVSGIHTWAHEAYWMGAYAGLAAKRILIDRVPWGVPVPVATIDGNSVFFEYSGVRGSQLVIDTDWIPEQPGYGWKVYDDEDVEGTINSVSLEGPTTVRFDLSAPASSGHRFRYAQSVTSNRSDNFTGGCGNIRDNYGDHVICEVINRPMHNWLPVHDHILP